MKRMRLWKRIFSGFIVGLLLAAAPSGFSQEEPPGGAEPLHVALNPPAPQLYSGRISLDFKEAEIQTVLQALARKAKLNIVTGKDVAGLVTIRLEEVTWEQALDTIVKTYGFGYEKDDNVILVTTLEEMKSRREAVKELVEIEPVTTKVIQLKFLDAADVKKFLEPQLTAQGKISVLEMTGQKGWAFGTAQAGGSSSEEDRERKERENSRSKAIVITDTPTTIDRLEKILIKIDVMPKQILIEARVMEVNRDLLRDLGLDFGTGATGVETATNLPTATPADKRGAGSGAINVTEFGAQVLATAVAPSVFVPKTSAIKGSGTAMNAGLEFLFRKLRGMEFEVIIRALEEDVRTNTLSAPHILTLSGQEAKILVGQKYPIIDTQISGSGSSATTTSSLSYYQDIGIELFVVPQVGGERHIDMIIHPVVSAASSFVTTEPAKTSYPILDVREAETQVVMEDGETIVIGGLLKDVKARSRIGLPFFGKLPLIGPIFSRYTTDLEKIDLLIFITARIVEPGSLSPEEISSLRHRYEEFLAKGSRKPKRQSASRRSQSKETSALPEAPGEPATENRGFLYQKQ